MRREAVGNVRLDDRIRELIELIEPVSDRLATLTADESSWVSISIERRFNDDRGVEENLNPLGTANDLVKLPGQHQLLGFHLDRELMARLIALNCSVDFDECG